MFVAEPILIDAEACIGPERKARTDSAAIRFAGSTLRRLASAQHLLSWHRTQRPAVGHKQVSARAWRRQSALICLQAGLEIEARR